jgi:hypothetical protein
MPIIREEFAARALIQSFSVRASYAAGLGTHYHIRPLSHRGISSYTNMSRTKWNTYRLDFNSEEGGETSIYNSVLHHQEQLIIHGRSSIYALPRSRKMWVTPIAVLLAPFQVQLYIEANRPQSASIWGDFRVSHHPHQDDAEYSVDLALNTAM